MGNEFVQTEQVNIRMGVAGLGAALFLAGLEKLDETAGVGLAWIAFITIMLTPFKGRAPAQEVLYLLGQKQGGAGIGNLGPANRFIGPPTNA